MHVVLLLLLAADARRRRRATIAGSVQRVVSACRTSIRCRALSRRRRPAAAGSGAAQPRSASAGVRRQTRACLSCATRSRCPAAPYARHRTRTGSGPREARGGSRCPGTSVTLAAPEPTHEGLAGDKTVGQEAEYLARWLSSSSRTCSVRFVSEGCERRRAFNADAGRGELQSRERGVVVESRRELHAEVQARQRRVLVEGRLSDRATSQPMLLPPRSRERRVLVRPAARDRARRRCGRRRRSVRGTAAGRRPRAA